MADQKISIHHQDPKKLAAGYSRSFRLVEILSIVSFFSMTAVLFYRVSHQLNDKPWLILEAFIVGYLLADFTSGFVHWMGDTWGSTEMPILGKALIRPFREHHVDQKAMTRHDYVETNGSNCLISVPWAFGALFIPLDSSVGLFAATAIGSMIFWVMMTNQFHKWSHLEESERPALVTFLQRWHLILPPEHHQIHHAAPYAKYYCITTGWLNWPLHKLHFFRIAERIVTGLFGLIPRKDDIGLYAALATAPTQPAALEQQTQRH